MGSLRLCGSLIFSTVSGAVRTLPFSPLKRREFRPPVSGSEGPAEPHRGLTDTLAQGVRRYRRRLASRTGMESPTVRPEERMSKLRNRLGLGFVPGSRFRPGAWEGFGRRVISCKDSEMLS